MFKRYFHLYGEQLAHTVLDWYLTGHADPTATTRLRAEAQRLHEAWTKPHPQRGDLWSHILTTGTHGHYIWQGATNNGHPTTMRRGARYSVARILYEETTQTPLHARRLRRVCSTRLCVHPDHHTPSRSRSRGRSLPHPDAPHLPTSNKAVTLLRTFAHLIDETASRTP